MVLCVIKTVTKLIILSQRIEQRTLRSSPKGHMEVEKKRESGTPGDQLLAPKPRSHNISYLIRSTENSSQEQLLRPSSGCSGTNSQPL